MNNIEETMTIVVFLRASLQAKCCDTETLAGRTGWSTLSWATVLCSVCQKEREKPRVIQPFKQLCGSLLCPFHDTATAGCWELCPGGSMPREGGHRAGQTASNQPQGKSPDQSMLDQSIGCCSIAKLYPTFCDPPPPPTDCST